MIVIGVTLQQQREGGFFVFFCFFPALCFIWPETHPKTYFQFCILYRHADVFMMSVENRFRVFLVLWCYDFSTNRSLSSVLENVLKHQLFIY